MPSPGGARDRASPFPAARHDRRRGKWPGSSRLRTAPRRRRRSGRSRPWAITNATRPVLARHDDHPRGRCDAVGDLAGRRNELMSVVEPGRSPAAGHSTSPRMVLHEDGVVVEPLKPDRAQRCASRLLRAQIAIGVVALGFAMMTAGWSAPARAPRYMRRPPLARAQSLPSSNHPYTHRRRFQRPSTAIRLSTPTGEMRNRPE